MPCSQWPALVVNLHRRRGVRERNAPGARQRTVAMDDAQRYRTNAADCVLAAELCARWRAGAWRQIRRIGMSWRQTPWMLGIVIVFGAIGGWLVARALGF